MFRKTSFAARQAASEPSRTELALSEARSPTAYHIRYANKTKYVLRSILLTISLLLLAAAAPDQPQSAAALPLASQSDRAAFRRWFTFLAEAQYFNPPPARPAEIVDCAALLRYAYREALRDHNSTWAAQSNLPLIPAIPSISQYHYPKTPIGPALFRIAPGRFAEFADAQTLYRYNVFAVGRDLSQAAPGDLLFYRRPTGASPFHTMIVLGLSQITQGSAQYVVYNTGPEGTAQGEIKRLTYQELLHFPNPQWQPIRQNSAFLGVFRWNILRDNL